VPTTGISLVREQTEAMQLPRFLWVPFDLGRPFGAPNEPEFQRHVLTLALELFERTDGPVVLEDFPDDAPESDEEAVWACPISFAPQPSAAPDLVRDVLAEVAQLSPWLEGVDPLNFNSGFTETEVVSFLGRVAAGSDVTDALAGRPSAGVIRLAADDLRTWYLRAARRQPGRASAGELNTWFWRETAFAHLLGETTARLRDGDDPFGRALADRALIPRDHMAFLIPDTPTLGEEMGEDDV